MATAQISPQSSTGGQADSLPGSGRPTDWLPWALIAPGVVMVLILFIYPYVTMIVESFRAADNTWNLSAYVDVLGSSLIWKVMYQTFFVALLSTVVTLVCSYPLAFLATTAHPAIRNAILWVTLVPLWTSILVRLYAWMAILGRNGIINNALMSTGLTERPISLLYGNVSVTIGTVHYLMPFMFLSLYSTLRTIDNRLLEASSTMGASSWQTFWRIYFPLSLPGVYSGCTLSFVLALGFYVTPALLGGARSTTAPVLVEMLVRQLQWQEATVTSLVLLICVCLILLVYRKLGQPAGPAHQ